ncbi:hypothetical protein B4U80_10344, partial [Leptotrombidium deliense]
SKKIKSLTVPLTNFDIEHFRGVFAKNSLPKKINELEYGIVNNDNLPGNGTHWVCYYNNPKNKYVEFFDSFGLAPAKEIQKYLETSNKKIKYNSTQIQDVLSIKCGYFCIDFIKDRISGKSMYDCIHKYSINFPIINDDLLCCV